MRKKLTPWFPVTLKPALTGVYNVSCDRLIQSGKWYSYWNGKRFGWYAPCPDEAYRQRQMVGAGGETQSWRGLAKKSA